MFGAVEAQPRFQLKGFEVALTHPEQPQRIRVCRRGEGLLPGWRIFAVAQLSAENPVPARDGVVGQLQARFPSLVFKQRAHFAGWLNLGVFVVVDADPEIQAADAGQGLVNARFKVDARLLEIGNRRAFRFVAVVLFVIVALFLLFLVVVLFFFLVPVIFLLVPVAMGEARQPVVGFQATH